MTIKVFGEKAKRIEEGQLFRAVRYSVEGRDCIELVPNEYFCTACGVFLKKIDLGHDDEDLVCGNKECKKFGLS